MTFDEYDRILEDAFSFLTLDFGYSSEPVKPGGGRFGSGFQKKYFRQNLTITLHIGDVDSQLFCSVFFSDGDDAKPEPSRRFFRQRTLYFLLLRKNLRFDHPSGKSLGSDSAKRDALYAYGKLVKECALDVVQGDFSAFPQLVYVVQHVDRKYATGEVRRLIGVYSSYRSADNAVSERLTKPGFVVRGDGFEVDCVELDFGNWVSGISIHEPEQTIDFFKRSLQASGLSEFSNEEQRELEARWLLKFSGFQDQYEVSIAQAGSEDERNSIAARYPRDHSAWSVALDEQNLRRRRSVFIHDLRSQRIAIECWRNARDRGRLRPRFIEFIEEELKDRQ